MIYSMEYIANETDITITSVMELKKKMKIKVIYDEEHERMVKIIDKIKRIYGKVTLSTINKYKVYHKLG